MASADELPPFGVDGTGPHERRLVGHVALVERRRVREAETGERPLMARRRAGIAADRHVARLSVRCEQREHGEERRAAPCAAADVACGDPGFDVGPVVPGKPSRIPVDVERVVVELVCAANRRRPRVPARRYHPASARPLAVVVHVLPDPGRAIAAPPEGHCQRLAVVECPIAAVGRLVAHYAVVVGVLAGQQGAAKRTAEREGREVVGERGPSPEQQAAGGPHDVDILLAGVVDEDHDDVGARRAYEKPTVSASAASVSTATITATAPLIKVALVITTNVAPGKRRRLATLGSLRRHLPTDGRLRQVVRPALDSSTARRASPRAARRDPRRPRAPARASRGRAP